MATDKDKAATAALAEQQNSGLIAAPDFIDADDYQGQGFEQAGKDAYALPFLQILQKMSPMVDEQDPKYIPGAKAGMIYNTVTQKLTDGKAGILLVPCYFKRSYIRWGGREGDGGFKGEVTPEEFDAIVASGQIEMVDNRPLVKDEKGETHPKKSDYYADTRSHYVLTIDMDKKEVGTAILSLSSSQIKASRMLMTALSQIRVNVGGVAKAPPMFAHFVRLTTVGLSNEKGSWSGAKFTTEGLVTDKNLYNTAKEFYKRVAAGEVKVDHSKNADATTGDVSGEPTKADEF